MRTTLKRTLTALLSVSIAASSVTIPNTAFAAEADVVPGRYGVIEDEPEGLRVVYDSDGNPLYTYVQEVEEPEFLEEDYAELLDGDTELETWNTKFDYNAKTGILMAEPYPFEIMEEDWLSNSSNRVGSYYLNWIDESYSGFLAISHGYNTLTPTFGDMRVKFANLYYNYPDFRQEAADGSVGMQITVRDSSQNPIAQSQVYQFKYDGCKEVNTIAPPEGIVRCGDEVYFQGVKGAVGYLFAEFYMEPQYDDNGNVIIHSVNATDSIQIRTNAEKLAIASIDENGNRSAFKVYEMPQDIRHTFDANVTYNKKTGLYGFDDYRPELPEPLFYSSAPTELFVTASNKYSGNAYFYIEKAQDGRYYIDKGYIMLRLALQAHGNDKKYEDYERNFYLTANVSGRYPYNPQHTSDVLVATSEYMDDEPYITYDGADTVDTIKAPTNLKRSGIEFSWDEVEGSVGYIFKLTTITGEDEYTTSSALTKSEKTCSISGKKGNVKVFAVDINGDVSEPAVLDFDATNEIIECPKTWDADLKTDPATYDATFNAYPVPDALTERYPNYSSYYTLCTRADSDMYNIWDDSGNAKTLKAKLLGELIGRYYTDKAFFGTQEVRARYRGRNIYAELGTYPVSTKGVDVSFYGPKSVDAFPAPDMKFTLSAFDDYLDYLMNDKIIGTEVEGAAGYIAKIDTKYGTYFDCVNFGLAGFDPSFSIPNYFTTFDISVAVVDAEGNVSKFTEPVTINYDESTTIGITHITSCTVNGNSLTLKWDAAKNAKSYGVALTNLETGVHRLYTNDVNGTSCTISNLEPGKYSAAIAPMDERGDFSTTVWDYEDVEFEITGTTPVKPVKPVVKATPGDGKVTLTWAAVPGATKYSVFTYLNGSYKAINTNVTGTSYTVTGLTNGTKYGFLVRAYVNGAWTTYTTADLVYATPAVTKPTATVAKVGDRCVTLTWKAVPGATKYSIFTYLNGTYKAINTNVTKTAYTVTGLANGTKYGFLVRAYVNGAWTTYTTADLVYATPAVTKPTPTIAKVGDRCVTLTWKAVPGATKYTVFSYLNGKYTSLNANVTTTTYTATGLTNGTKYGFLVRAFINGAWTTYTTADLVYATPAATKPTPTVAKVGDRCVTLTWKAVPGATKYSVFTYFNGTYKAINTNVTKTAYTVTGLANGTKYGFLVRAYVNGAWSAYTTADLVYATPVVTKPTPTVAKVGDRCVTLTWKAVPGATKYTVFSYLNGKYTSLNANVTTTTYTATGLANGTKYGFLVRAYVNGAWSAYTTADLVYATPVGAAKPAVTVAKVGDRCVTLTWKAVPGATKYMVFSYLNGKYTSLNANVTGTAYTATGLVNGTKYGFLVRAYVNGEWSAYTTADLVYATPVGSAKPVVRAAAGNGRVTLSWGAVSGATKYLVFSNLNGTYKQENANCTTTSYTVTGLTNGTKYGFLVRAYVNGAWTAYTSADLVYATPVA